MRAEGLQRGLLTTFDPFCPTFVHLLSKRESRRKSMKRKRLEERDTLLSFCPDPRDFFSSCATPLDKRTKGWCRRTPRASCGLPRMLDAEDRRGSKSIFSKTGRAPRSAEYPQRALPHSRTNTQLATVRTTFAHVREGHSIATSPASPTSPHAATRWPTRRVPKWQVKSLLTGRW